MAGPGGEMIGTLRVLADELDRKRSAQESKRASMDGKASVLIAGSGVFVGLLDSQSAGVPIKVGVVLALVAAVCGVLALWPQRGPEVQLDGEREKWAGLDLAEVEYGLYMDKLEAHQGDVGRLTRAGWSLRVGFCAFAAAVAAIVVSAFL